MPPMQALHSNKTGWPVAGLVALVLILPACRSTPVAPPPSAPPLKTPAAAAEAVPTPAPVAPFPAQHLRRAQWHELPGWAEDDHAAAWSALITGCSTLRNQEPWRAVCAQAQALPRPGRAEAQRFFESQFLPYRLTRPDGGNEGLATGYYEPLLRGSRTQTPRYRHPLYGVPDDLLTVDLPAFNAEPRDSRARARLDGRRVVPYHERAHIESPAAPLRGREIAWVDDPVELFFLQIQGSGRLELEGGGVMRVGFADHNGHPYRSIGRVLIDSGELPAERASMQGIKAWAQQNPGKLRAVLDANPRYVFFRELPPGLDGPLGAQGVPLTARRSIAADPRFVPLGAPVFLATTWPLSNRPLNQLMLAQDTGSAIRGAVRADFFWGYGEDAGREAGRMKQSLRMWLLLPRDYPLEGLD